MNRAKMLFGMGRKKVDAAGTAITNFIVNLDPETAGEVEIQQMDKYLDELLTGVVEAHNDWEREESEAVAVENEQEARIAAANELKSQIKSGELSAAKEKKVKASLLTLLKLIQENGPDVEREREEADDAKELLDTLELEAEEFSTQLKNLQKQIKDAIRARDKAEAEQKRQQRKAEQTAVLAGVKAKSSKFGLAVGAINAKAQAAENAAEAASRKSALLAETDAEEDDPIIAAALAKAKGVKPAKSEDDDMLAAFLDD